MMGALNFQEKFIITSKACLICSVIRVTNYCSMKMILEQELDLGILVLEFGKNGACSNFGLFLKYY